MTSVPGDNQCQSIYIDDILVFDGRKWIGKAGLLVEDGRVTELTRSRPRRGMKVLSGTGMSAFPGLIDSHIHLFPGYISKMPLFGVTMAVDMFATPDLLSILRSERSHSIYAADFISAGIGAAVAGGHPFQLVRAGLYHEFPEFGADASAEEFIRDRKAEGSSFLKVFVEDGSLVGSKLPRLETRQVRELCRAAHASDLKVVAHAVAPEMAAVAVAAGADGLAHAIVPRADVDCAELIGRMTHNGTFVVSTLTSIRSMLGFSNANYLLGSPLISIISPQWRKYLGLTKRAAPDESAWSATVAALCEMARAGVRILAGTDAAFPGVMPGASLHTELELLVDCGMSIESALSAATAEPAEVFDLAGHGRIAPGSVADIVIVRGDLRQDIRRTQNIVAVIKAGRIAFHQGVKEEQRS